MDHRDRDPRETHEIRDGPAVPPEEHRPVEEAWALLATTVSGE